MLAIRRAYRKDFGDRAFWDFPADSDQRLAAFDLDREWRRTWGTLKADAIERAFMDPMV